MSSCGSQNLRSAALPKSVAMSCAPPSGFRCTPVGSGFSFTAGTVNARHRIPVIHRRSTEELSWPVPRGVGAMNVMSAGCHPARSPPTAGSWLRIGTLARCCCPRSRRWSRDSTAPNPRERGRQSREQFTAGTRRAHWPLGRWAGRATHKPALWHGRTQWPCTGLGHGSNHGSPPMTPAYVRRPTSAGLTGLDNHRNPVMTSHRPSGS